MIFMTIPATANGQTTTEPQLAFFYATSGKTRQNKGTLAADIIWAGAGRALGCKKNGGMLSMTKVWRRTPRHTLCALDRRLGTSNADAAAPSRARAHALEHGRVLELPFDTV